MERRCRVCGSDRYVERHHIIPTSVGGTDDPKNIIYLCPTCHRLAHVGRKRTLIIRLDRDLIARLVNVGYTYATIKSVFDRLEREGWTIEGDETESLARLIAEALVGKR